MGHHLRAGQRPQVRCTHPRLRGALVDRAPTASMLRRRRARRPPPKPRRRARHVGGGVARDALSRVLDPLQVQLNGLLVRIRSHRTACHRGSSVGRLGAMPRRGRTSTIALLARRRGGRLGGRLRRALPRSKVNIPTGLAPPRRDDRGAGAHALSSRRRGLLRGVRPQVPPSRARRAGEMALARQAVLVLLTPRRRRREVPPARGLLTLLARRGRRELPPARGGLAEGLRRDARGPGHREGCLRGRLRQNQHAPARHTAQQGGGSLHALA
mmetsp:Transcript_129658/g.414810  ORF Transcript_129658/g.414810 Transcript_129658/m.414810 type:complete len:270 (+) Transcript_129658:560-1369(+)